MNAKELKKYIEEVSKINNPPVSQLLATLRQAWGALDDMENKVGQVMTGRLMQHIKLCRRNLKNKRVKCCATCPFEIMIVETYPDTKSLFEQKRRSLG